MTFNRIRTMLFVAALSMGAILSVNIAGSAGELTPETAHAQGPPPPTSCDTMVRDALRTIGSACATLGENEICYGNASINATLSDQTLTFDASGDIVPVTAIEQMVTRPANPATGEWGVALANIRADLPSTATESVRLVLFGGVELTPDTPSSDPNRSACTFNNANDYTIRYRSAPTTASDALGSLDAQSSTEVYGLNADGTWVRSAGGWMLASLGDITCESGQALPRFDNPDDIFNAPLQSFTMTLDASGACEAAPSGMLIQAPTDEFANVRINGVELRVGSTAAIVFEDDTLQFGNIEGDVRVSFAGETVDVRPGTMASLDIDRNQRPTTQPVLEDQFSARVQGMNQAFIQNTLTRDVTAAGPVRFRDNANLIFVDDGAQACLDLNRDGEIDNDTECFARDDSDADDLGENLRCADLDGNGQIRANVECVAERPAQSPPDRNFDCVDLNGNGTIERLRECRPNDDTSTRPNDRDGDGIPDIDDDCPRYPNDTIGDPCDPNDNTPNDDDPNNDDPNIIVPPDRDGDGIPDAEDECPTQPLQDDIGDPCVLDEDRDGVRDTLDECPFYFNDAIGDPCDPNDNNPNIIVPPDRDGDGIPDADDDCPSYPNDDIGDACNPDEDGDGVRDTLDECPFYFNDAIRDPCDPNDNTPNIIVPPDRDGDGIPDADDDCPDYPNDDIGDACNPDEDRDGIPDAEDPDPFAP